MKLHKIAVTGLVLALMTGGSRAAEDATNAGDEPAAETPAAEAAEAAETVQSAAPGPEAGSDQVAAPESYSEAETMLWLTDQLKSIEQPSRLKYEFKKSGSLEEGFTDSVQLDITELLPDGMKKANVNFFTGARNHYVPPYESTNGNPLLAIFLHGDVLEMNRLTDGGWRYFHRRIKFAFADKAEISPVDIEFNGNKVKGKQVRIRPYVDDPKAETSEKFRKLKDKIYLFTISDDIPGYVYEIRTVVPPPQEASGNEAPLMEEYLKLTTVEPM